MSGLIYESSRRGDRVAVWLYKRGGWPTAEGIAKDTLNEGETLRRVDVMGNAYRFTVERAD